MPYPTGDGISDLRQWFVFSLPLDTWVQATFLGQLQYLLHSPSFLTGDEVTPAQAAQMFNVIVEGVIVTNPLTGAILPFAADNMEFINQNPSDGPSGLLKCDGSSYLAADFPALFAVIGYTWGGSGANFNVPDLQGRAPIGDGSGSGLSTRIIGNVGGEESHTLSVAEMPSHVHTEGNATPTLADITTPTTIVGVPSVTVTGSTGGDTPHNNMQPFSVVAYYIVAY